MYPDGGFVNHVRPVRNRWKSTTTADPVRVGRRAVRGGARGTAQSLDRDAGAGSLELLLGLVRGLLVDLLEDGLRGGLDQLLGLLEAQAGERAHLLDDVDLLLAGGLEDDVELVLLGGRLLATGGATGGRRGCDGDGGGGGHAEGVLELLHELAELQEGHLLESVEQLVGAELRHGGVPYVVAVRSAPDRGVSWVVGQASVGSASAAASAGASAGSSSAVSAAGSSGAGCSAAAAGAPAPAARSEGSCSAFACRAPARRAACASGALSRYTAWLSDASIAPASLPRSTSRDSRSASLA